VGGYTDSLRYPGPGRDKSEISGRGYTDNMMEGLVRG
jgi:hypothetical protein